jgi:hypothetical protein
MLNLRSGWDCERTGHRGSGEASGRGGKMSETEYLTTSVLAKAGTAKRKARRVVVNVMRATPVTVRHV